MEKPVTFRNRGKQLVGMLHVPDELHRGDKAPAIVMFHGFTGNRTEAHRLFVQVARNLCSARFLVLRFDFLGSGDSEGEFDDMTVRGEVNDAEKSLDFLEDQPLVDGEKIGVIGLSLGGRVASILASEDERLKFAVLLSPALGPLKEAFTSHMDDEARERLKKGEAIKVSEGWYLKKPFFDTLDDPVPFNVMDRIRAPVLIIHGDNDEVVPIETSKKGYEITKDLNDKNELYVIKGADHTFSEREHTLEVIKKTREWLLSLRLGTSPNHSGGFTGHKEERHEHSQKKSP